MKLIIECDEEGRVFVYEESESHYRIAEPEREKKLIRGTLESRNLDEDCALRPGEYLAIPLIEV